MSSKIKISIKIIIIILILIANYNIGAIIGKEKSLTTNIKQINISEKTICNHKAKLYTKKDKIKIYTYCVEKIKIKTKAKEKDLKNYLKENSLNNLINALKIDQIIKDGGTTIYKKNNIKLIKCNTLEGNKDIYIGTKNMPLKSNFCKKNNKTFIKTYTVTDIIENTNNTQQVTLNEFQKEENTVTINNIDEKLEKNKTYEFEFMQLENNQKKEDNIEYIFNNATIVEIRPTDKIGLNQIQESIE